MSKRGFTIVRADFQELQAAQYRVLELLADEKWHNRQEVQISASRDDSPAINGVGRLREVRAYLQGRGYTIVCRRIGANATEYKLEACSHLEGV